MRVSLRWLPFWGKRTHLEVSRLPKQYEALLTVQPTSARDARYVQTHQGQAGACRRAADLLAAEQPCAGRRQKVGIMRFAPRARRDRERFAPFRGSSTPLTRRSFVRQVAGAVFLAGLGT